MATIIDRRENPGGKNLPNRQRFFRRQREQIKQAVTGIIRSKDIQDVANGKTRKIKVTTKDTHEWMLVYGKGGKREFVLPGNKEFVPQDTIPLPPQGHGSGRAGSSGGEGNDDYVFSVDQEEFLNLVFEDLELPDMVKKAIFSDSDIFRLRPAGIKADGAPCQLELVRTMKNSISRRLAFRTAKKRKLRELEEERKKLEAKINNANDDTDTSDWQAELNEVMRKIKALERQLKAIPYIDDVDLRFRRHEKEILPICKAVMFCMMDVSGSMSERDKDLAKRFFLLLYLFLQRKYDKVDVVFIRHTSEAKEVDEKEFFYSKETGGTLVSSGLKLIHKICQERYPSDEWNIYTSQISDGDNWDHDNPETLSALSLILPLMQYFSYVQTNNRDSEIWKLYSGIKKSYNNFAMARVNKAKEIITVFRELFKKRSAKWTRQTA